MSEGYRVFRLVVGAALILVVLDSCQAFVLETGVIS